MKCQRCDGMQCNLKNCDDILDGTPICKSSELSTIKSTTNGYIYTTKEDLIQLNSTNRMQDIKRKICHRRHNPYRLYQIPL